MEKTKVKSKDSKKNKFYSIIPKILKKNASARNFTLFENTFKLTKTVSRCYSTSLSFRWLNFTKWPRVLRINSSPYGGEGKQIRSIGMTFIVLFFCKHETASFLAGRTAKTETSMKLGSLLLIWFPVVNAINSFSTTSTRILLNSGLKSKLIASPYN